eukprot:TRINITY_DN7912_c1_g1_i1.p1 TRINITY_DN7912_c1_g1~~TRINITY_DN7912_c1_g1_i1.p1  ORF type:complete len:296 (+),score=99.33 TRINITY_DN7912_c1_g1_i1:315-1202(+)
MIPFHVPQSKVLISLVDEEEEINGSQEDVEKRNLLSFYCEVYSWKYKATVGGFESEEEWISEAWNVISEFLLPTASKPILDLMLDVSEEITFFSGMFDSTLVQVKEYLVYHYSLAIPLEDELEDGGCGEVCGEGCAEGCQEGCRDIRGNVDIDGEGEELISRKSTTEEDSFSWNLESSREVEYLCFEDLSVGGGIDEVSNSKGQVIGGVTAVTTAGGGGDGGHEGSHYNHPNGYGYDSVNDGDNHCHVEGCTDGPCNHGHVEGYFDDPDNPGQDDRCHVEGCVTGGEDTGHHYNP